MSGTKEEAMAKPEEWLCFEDPEVPVPCLAGTDRADECGHCGSGKPKETCSSYRKVRYYSCPDCAALRAEVERLKAAGNALYDAAHWTADRDADEAALWESLRDALGREPGGAPKPLGEEVQDGR